MTDRPREDLARRWAHRYGYVLLKDRARNRTADHQGGFMIVEPERNVVVAGKRFDLDLDVVEAFISSQRASS